MEAERKMEVLGGGGELGRFVFSTPFCLESCNGHKNSIVPFSHRLCVFIGNASRTCT